MGDPRKTRKKYNTPNHPWQKERIEEEKQIIDKYALKNKKEIWKMTSLLKSFKNQAKKLTSLNTAQSEKEQELLLQKLVRYGILSAGDKLDAILILQPEDVLERRLQTVVMKRGLARSMKQARQFITHRHIKIKNNVVTSPSHLVPADQEEQVTFSGSSSLSDATHPERAVVKKPEEEAVLKKKAEKKDTKKEEKAAPAKESKKEAAEEKPAESKESSEGEKK